ncbi:MAG TPA: cyanophycinase [Candidatus Obscuribacter sp.]|nr:cyanophycinase [Candidatus Obscuribacter sp.]HND07762.1 cyanophycinase [Candidatus Obscuribacter sp.]
MDAPSTPGVGTLFLIGGKANETLNRFVELSGGKQALIVILPHASSIAAEVSAELSKTLLDKGAGQCCIIMPGEDRSLPEGTTAVYLMGGDQARLVEAVSGKLLADIKQHLASGGVVAGTSAGSTASSQVMITGNMEDDAPETLPLAPGFNFLPGFTIDTHVGQRNRVPRIRVAVSRLENTIGIGLDEDTAFEIKDAHVSVHGVGKGCIVMGPVQNQAHEDSPTKFVSPSDMDVFVYTAGDKFQLPTSTTSFPKEAK